MKKLLPVTFTSALLCLVLFVLPLSPVNAGVDGQDDPVEAYDVAASVPTIDGVGDEAVWVSATWQPIDEMWIKVADNLSASDYSGKFKVLWSSTENMLYFLVEVTDEFFSDGYTWVDESSQNYVGYDFVEVFIDEDSTGGLHVFDEGNPNPTDLGTNAENAFSYHVQAVDPGSGNVTTDFFAVDIFGNSWTDRTANYTNHFGGFALKNNGDNTYTREFSLKVMDDTYDYVTDNQSTARVTLTEGKTMGLCLAYADNDQDDGARDNFIGSYAAPSTDGNGEYNEAWKDATDYPRVKLMGSAISDTEDPTVPTGLASSEVKDTSFVLSWTASTDNVGVAAYEIYEGTTKLGESTTTSFTVTGLVANTTYSVSVLAKDAAGNTSAKSTALDVTTSGPNTIEVINSKDQISIYPVPARENVNIALSGSYIGNVQITIIDITGKEITHLTSEKANGELSLNISLEDVGSGIHFVKIIRGEQTDYKKIIVY